MNESKPTCGWNEAAPYRPPESEPPVRVQPAGSAALGDKELASEIIQCLRMNMLRGTMTTENDEQFLAFIDAWAQGKSAIGIKPPNAEVRHGASGARPD